MSDFAQAEQEHILKQNGWIPLKLLGEGGGARVFKVMSANAAERLVAPLLTPADRDAAVTQARGLLLTLSDLIAGDEVSVAAAKFAKKREWRTRDEILVLSAIRHRNLIQLLDYDKRTEPAWYVMPLLRKGTILDHLRSLTGDLPRIVKGITEVAEALGALHRKGITHRDVKPANIFMGDDEGWILGDPGVAYLPDREEDSHTRIGSKDYLPRWHDDPLSRDPAADLYMLAATTLLLLTGKKILAPSHLVPGRFWLSEMLPPAPGIAELQELMRGLFVEDRADSTHADGNDLADSLRELAAELNPPKALQESPPDQVFYFGASAGSTQGSSHPALDESRVWIPHNRRRLVVYSRFIKARDTVYTLTIKPDRGKSLTLRLDTGKTQEVALDASADAPSGWSSLSVSSSGQGTALILVLSVFATR